MRWLRAYLQRKQSEQQAPQDERLLQIRYEKALQRLARRHCPSCERSLAGANAPLPDSWMHSGLRIQTHRQRCDHHHPALYPYCSSGGAPTELQETPASSAGREPLTPAAVRPAAAAPSGDAGVRAGCRPPGG